jgi:methylenetetrahydrofolate dehydrogenase (NADP+)/methenyltetrahydrofolate cyclohydrolase
MDQAGYSRQPLTVDRSPRAAGRPGWRGACQARRIVDVGINPTENSGVIGDVDAETVASSAGALTPVPGGVGPVTTMLILRHVTNAAAAAHLV